MIQNGNEILEEVICRIAKIVDDLENNYADAMNTKDLDKLERIGISKICYKHVLNIIDEEIEKFLSIR